MLFNTLKRKKDALDQFKKNTLVWYSYIYVFFKFKYDLVQTLNFLIPSILIKIFIFQRHKHSYEVKSLFIIKTIDWKKSVGFIWFN